jgi:hypothetical protein
MCTGVGTRVLTKAGEYKRGSGEYKRGPGSTNEGRGNMNESREVERAGTRRQQAQMRAREHEQGLNHQPLLFHSGRPKPSCRSSVSIFRPQAPPPACICECTAPPPPQPCQHHHTTSPHHHPLPFHVACVREAATAAVGEATAELQLQHHQRQHQRQGW